ncbi:hypothetical protein PYCCODRAFT_1385320 [Trametes coccinea BRFM310]|uniref:Prolyl 4-hydroxylase alpha subunit Fe(2+) 2OG dioxygenase domain-containing protein n=1 Tax=Trametes coccinea (strain BRFM310) TaxID=1353009 RepID=A0A1Y2IZW2_TRAC3|nr:hypothetical protein PYCCODRAFT_1385320 [Trametes coccinea BRFM310]
MKAFKDLNSLPCIGDCPSIEAAQINEMSSYRPYAAQEAIAELPPSKEDMRSEEELAIMQHNAKRVQMLEKLCRKVNNHACGYLNHPFQLRITRRGCEFDAPITPSPVPESDVRDEAEAKRLEELLKRWYDHATVSGYGDVHEQVTKVDSEVRNAREISASEFTVGRKLLRSIQRQWRKHFVPGTRVRAEPYKIHLYGPGGGFKEHRDTPQKDLVGTFLLGLGDTTGRGEGLYVDGKRMTAHPGQWCAFYPDVPHHVATLYKGYRAVIAFKIFRAGKRSHETKQTARLREQVTQVLKKMKPTYGILLEHKYCLATEYFNGFDAILLDAARSLKGLEVHHLPVAVGMSSEWGSDDYKPWTMECGTTVHPFARSYIELSSGCNDSLDEDGEEDIHVRCGYPWLAGKRNIPFFGLLGVDRYCYKAVGEGPEETVNYVGNEAEAWREDSVYLSYALVVLKAGDSNVASLKPPATSSTD